MIILNSPYFLVEIYIFRCHDIKDEEIYDPMDKIWVRKELYKETYEFLNFMEFYGFILIFKAFSWFNSLKKRAKIMGRS